MAGTGDIDVLDAGAVDGEQHPRLDLARGIEEATALLRSLRGQLAHGPYPRTRKRVRRQCRKLLDALELAQLRALSDALDRDVAATVGDVVAAVLPELESALYHHPRKPRLKALRRSLKAQRKALDAALAATAEIAA